MRPAEPEERLEQINPPVNKVESSLEESKKARAGAVEPSGTDSFGNGLFVLCDDCGFSHKKGAPHQVVFKNEALRVVTARDPKSITTTTLPNGLKAHKLNSAFHHISVARMGSNGRVISSCATSAGQLKAQFDPPQSLSQ